MEKGVLKCDLIKSTYVLPTRQNYVPRTSWGRPQNRYVLMYFVLASINVILLKWPPQQSRLTMRKNGIWVASWWITRCIYFFHQKILSSSILSFIKLINFFHQDCLILPNVFYWFKWQENQWQFLYWTTLTFYIL